MDIEFAEAPGEVTLLHRRQVLMLEEQHLVREQGRPDFGDQGVGDRGVQTHALDERADGRRQRNDAEGCRRAVRHGGQPPAILRKNFWPCSPPAK